jgi:serine/threonine protein phosphatase PrpC
MLNGKADPTPNQDNCFVRAEGAITLYGVCDGHGPFGHLVSFRLSQTLPHFMVASSNWGKNWELAFKDAFASAQAELVSFAQEQGINIQASGAAASVLLLEEQTVHLAFIGDCRIMIGSWNRHDSRMIFATRDHKPDLPEEKSRLEAAGSEVREVDPGSHRVYKQGSNFPGLTMSRSFGDSACAGVLQEPEYHQLLLQPTDQWYALLASDGIWELLESEEVLGLTAKKVRLKGPRETLSSLVAASRKRWAYCCGDYCDDMTAVLVQWNAPEARESKANHSLTARSSA